MAAAQVGNVNPKWSHSDGSGHPKDRVVLVTTGAGPSSGRSPVCAVWVVAGARVHASSSSSGSALVMAVISSISHEVGRKGLGDSRGRGIGARPASGGGPRHGSAGGWAGPTRDVRTRPVSTARSRTCRRAGRWTDGSSNSAPCVVVAGGPDGEARDASGPVPQPLTSQPEAATVGGVGVIPKRQRLAYSRRVRQRCLPRRH